MLKIGGILNILIAIAHIIGLFWAEQMFKKTGALEGMQELAKIYHTLPYLLTVFVAIMFFVFGLYGVLADSKKRKLPFLKFGIFAIAFIYLFRSIGEQSYNILKGTTTKPETIQSIIALFIGLLFLFGGYTKWKLEK